MEYSEVPLKQNGLAKIKGAIPQSLTAYTKERFDGTRRRTTHDDHKVVKQARRLICNNPKLKEMSLTEESAREVMEQIFEDIIALLSTNAESTLFPRTRLKSLEQQLKKDSFFPKLICEQWEKSRKNSGNPAPLGFPPRKLKRTMMRSIDGLKSLLPNPKRPKGHPFLFDWEEHKWIWNRSNGRARNGILSTNGKPNWKYIHNMTCDSPLPCTDFFVHLLYSSFLGRLRNKRLKGQTRQTRATRHIEYGVHLDNLIFSDDEKIFWTCVHLTHKQKKNVITALLLLSNRVSLPGG